MSRRKDRERVEAMKRLNPDYAGFRGHDQEPGRPGGTPLATAVCSVCGRRRNVPVGVALQEGEAFVCLSCQEERAGAGTTEKPAEAPEAAPAESQPA